MLNTTANITGAQKVKLTAKGKTHAPRPSAMGNHINWQAMLTLLNKGPSTVSALQAAIVAANTSNQGNALPYIKYQVRNANLALAS